MNLNETRIAFSRNVNSQSFEETLKEYYNKSLASYIVKFDFTNVNWCDLFELTLIVLWIKELSDLKEKRIIFYSPNNEYVKSFLAKYEFGRFLGENDIVTELRYTNIGGDILYSTPYFPIKFYKEESFNEFLSYLSDSNNYSSTFSGIINSGFVKKEQLRNVIIQELGDNMYRHADGIYANMAMAKFGISSIEKIKKNEWRNNLIRNASSFEKPFFEKLNGNDYFTIVISDKGPGIFKTLRENFEVNNKGVKYNECDVLEYAFTEQSTSRTIEERLGELAEVYENFNSLFGDKAPVLPPPTGLYMLLNIVKEFLGFIYVRSGKSIIAYDFFNDRKAIKSSETSGFKRLANFGGTQIKIHFPIDISKSLYTYQRNKFLFPETDKKIKYKYLSLTDYFSESNKESYSVERSSIFKFIGDVDQYKTSNSNNLSGIVLDLAELRCLSTKALYFVIAKLMSSQEKDFTNVLINISPQSISSLKKAFIPTSPTPIRPIILFDTNYKRAIIGVNENDEELFKRLFVKKVFDDPKDSEFILKNDHLFIAEDSVSFKHQRRTIFRTALMKINNKLNELILDPFYKIYYPEVKVLLPSRIFCEGYFEISSLLKQPENKSLIKQWFTYLIFETKPVYIITIGTQCNKIAFDIFKEKEIYGSPYPIEHYAIESPTTIDFTELYELSYKFIQSETVIVFCDVVGTTNTLHNILKHFSNNENLHLYAIVNATENSIEHLIVNDKKIPISALAVKKVSFYKDRPVNWTDEVLFNVDPLNNNLIRRKVQKPLPLWDNNSDKDFIEDIIKKDNKYLVGHFALDNTHLTYLLDIPLITKNHGDAISEIILNHFKKNETALKHKSDLGKVIYFNDKKGLKEIVRIIATSLYFSVEMISNSEMISNDNYEGVDYFGKTVILIESAFDSGENIMRMIDMCVRKKAANIYIYIIFKRGSDYSARKLSRMEKYGGANIFFNFLAEINIPTYNINNCPVCINNKRLESLNNKLKEEKGLQKLTMFIDDEIIHTKPVNLKSVLDEHYSFEKFQTSYSSSEIYYRALLEDALINLSARDQIVNQIINYRKHEENLIDVLLIFKIIVKEQLFRLIDKKIEGDQYEFDFKSGIIRVCLHCITHVSSLDLEQLNAILTLLVHVDEDRFIEKFYSLVSKTMHHDRKFLLVLKHLYLCNKAYNYPESIINALQSLNNVPQSIEKLIEQVRFQWEHKLATPNILVIEYLQKLKVFNHEIQNHINNLKGLLIIEEFDKPITADWTHLQNYFKAICYYLKELGEFDFANKYINTKALTLINKLRKLMDQGQNGILLNNNVKSQLLVLNPIISKIEDILFSEDGNLQSILELCETNIYNLINYTLKLFEIEFKGVRIEYSVPEIATIAFGDKNGLQEIFSNIIKNIFIHAKATSVLIAITIETSDNSITVSIYDNGKKLPANLKYHIGLNKCKENATRYFGVFSLIPMEETDPMYLRGFVKEAKVRLNYIPQRDTINFNIKEERFYE